MLIWFTLSVNGWKILGCFQIVIVQCLYFIMSSNDHSSLSSMNFILSVICKSITCETLWVFSLVTVIEPIELDK